MKFNSQILKNIVKEAIENGFTVYRFQDTVEQVFIGDHKGVCMVRNLWQQGVNLYTVHKSNKQCGKEFLLLDNVLSLSMDEIKSACSLHIPAWDQVNVAMKTAAEIMHYPVYNGGDLWGWDKPHWQDKG